MPEVAVARSLPPIRFMILVALWVAFVIWMMLSAAGDVSMTASSPIPGYRVSPAYQAVLLALDLWALLAAAIVGLMGANPFGWLNGKRLIAGTMAFAVMLGRLVAGWFTYLLLFTQAPAAPLVLTMPFVLLIGGVLVIFAIAAMIGLLFGFFVFVPVLMANQLFAFEREIAKYRYHASGLANFIVRAVYWLRNEPLPKSPPSETKGARFATQDEAAAIHNTTKGNPARMGFGHWPGKTDTPFFVATDKHVLVMASTRSGKGVGLTRFRGRSVDLFG